MKDLYADFELVAGARDDWQEFSCWHYRTNRICFVDRIFMLKHSSGTPAAIAVYGFAHANNRIRNVALSHMNYMQVPIWQKLKMINHDFRTISRVVVRPEFRGIALGSELLRRTMPLLNVRFIEAIAVMAKYSQLFCRAGMQMYDQQANKHIINTQKFMNKNQFDNDQPIMTLANNILIRNDEEQEMIIRYLHNFCCHYKRSLRRREPDRNKLTEYLGIVRSHLTTTPAYYLYDRVGALSNRQTIP